MSSLIAPFRTTAHVQALVKCFKDDFLLTKREREREILDQGLQLVAFPSVMDTGLTISRNAHWTLPSEASKIKYFVTDILYWMRGVVADLRREPRHGRQLISIPPMLYR